MRTFAPRVEPVQGLDELGQCELREIPVGPLRVLRINATNEKQDSVLAIVGASLYVDGEAIGYEALCALPGRFSKALDPVFTACLQLHDIIKADDADTDGNAPPGEA